jgi:putative ABC transport system permease protein
MIIWENIRLAFKSIRSNWIRSLITAMIIAFGIMSLVGILTAIDSILGSMSSSFSSLGANSFTIERKGERLGGRRGGMAIKQGEAISYREATSFKKQFAEKALVSLSVRANSLSVVRHGDTKTNPNISVVGVDENYLAVQGYDLELGRNFSEWESESAAPRIILGKDLVEILFDGNSDKAIQSIVYLQSQAYRVVGILKSKGSNINQSADKVVLIPLQLARQQFQVTSQNFPVAVYAPSPDRLKEVIDQSIATMRGIRKLRPGQENDFEIRQSDSLLNILKDNTTTIRIATVGIALITLLGAAIGLMNIMLVSVTERTREIGLRKAVGASRRHITVQFLTETLVICQLGGILGVLLGILAGNGVSFFTGGIFIIPWIWIIVGLVTCIVIGILSGIYPALKAANMDPIEALRHE